MLFNGLVLALTFFLIAGLGWGVRLNGIGVEVATIFIVPASVFVKEKLEVIVIQFKSDHLSVFNYFCVLIEPWVWLLRHLDV